MLEIHRVYDEKGPSAGYRILVDRLWPRGLKKADVAADLWLKDVAPSSELRKWFGHDPEKWKEFRRRYFRELKDRQQELDVIASHAKKGKVVLLYAARDAEHNHALVLKEYLESSKV